MLSDLLMFCMHTLGNCASEVDAKNPTNNVTAAGRYEIMLILVQYLIDTPGTAIAFQDFTVVPTIIRAVFLITPSAEGLCGLVWPVSLKRHHKQYYCAADSLQ